MVSRPGMARWVARAGCSPVADHAGVMVEPLVEPAPVVSNQVQVKVVGGHRGFPVAQLLEGPLAEEQGGTTCTAKTHWVTLECIVSNPAHSLRHSQHGAAPPLSEAVSAHCVRLPRDGVTPILD